ncbi:MAG TPA: AraC family transcriptional regulator [Candidatus Eisenbergiella merdipullorum]|uniref:AraC family transcriptional regulator n=1 Tax=Candidatus Eisenbergiella merdipullorum TaxID=2838553 RepID=A0A9D2I4E0_9FIRM|nr:AraC family transcriptional regulator [Candidatus Eisenbergiella merdipullorum]
MRTELVTPTVAGSSIHFSPDRRLAETESICDWHLHDEYELVYVFEGTRIFYVNNEEYRLEKGDIIFVNERVPHQTKSPVGSGGLLLQFGVPDRAKDVGILSGVLQLTGSKTADAAVLRNGTVLNKQITECVEGIESEFIHREKAYDLMIKSYVNTILTLLYRNNVIPWPEDFLDREEIHKFIPVFQYVNEHCDSKLSLSEASRLLNVDKSHFCRIFKKALKCSFIQYTSLVRICRAEEMLTETDKSIAEIAYETGFASTAYFIKTFKQRRGYTPLAYRKMKQ